LTLLNAYMISKELLKPKNKFDSIFKTKNIEFDLLILNIIAINEQFRHFYSKQNTPGNGATSLHEEKHEECFINHSG